MVVAENAWSCPACDEGVTLVNTVPSVMAELLHSSALPPSVLTVNLAGEPLSTLLVDRLYEQPGVEKVYDLYGPSETTTYSTFTLRRPGEPATIGRPIANTRVYVLDPTRQPVPVGGAGRAVHRGDGLARGYWNRPGADRGAVRAGPLLGSRASASIRTGDLAAMAGGRPAGVPGPHRSPGEAARLPHRAGRDRGRARRAPVGAATRWWSCARTTTWDSGWWPTSSGGGPALAASCAPDACASGFPSTWSLRSSSC